MVGSDERAAPTRRFHNQNAERQTAENAVSHREMRAERGRSRRVFAQQTAMRANIAEQPRVRRRIHNIRAAAEHRRNRSARRQRALERHGVNAVCAAGDDKTAHPPDLKAERFRLHHPIAGGFACTDHGNDRSRVKIRHRAAAIEHQRRVVEIAQTLGVGRVLHSDDLDVLLEAVAQDLICTVQFFILQRRRFAQTLDLPQRSLIREPDLLRRRKLSKQEVHLPKPDPLARCEP